MSSTHERLFTLGEGASSLAEALQGLPPAAHLLAAGVLAAGLVLWAMGRRVLRPAFTLLGVGVGAGVGFLGAPGVGINTIAGIPAPYVGLAIGAVIGLVLALLLFRMAVATSTALVGAAALVMLAVGFMHIQRPGGVTGEFAEAGDRLRERVRELEEGLDGGMEPWALEEREGDERAEWVAGAAERTREFLRELGGELQSGWDRLSGWQRLVLGVGAVAGAVLGFLLGLLAPVRASAALTAMIGAAAWLPAGVWLVNAMDAPGRAALERGALAWLVIWMVVACIGAAIQITGLPKKPVRKKIETE